MALLTVEILIISRVESTGEIDFRQFLDDTTYPIEDLFLNHYPPILKELRNSRLRQTEMERNGSNKWNNGYIRIIGKRGLEKYARQNA